MYQLSCAIILEGDGDQIMLFKKINVVSAPAVGRLVFDGSDAYEVKAIPEGISKIKPFPVVFQPVKVGSNMEIYRKQMELKGWEYNNLFSGLVRLKFGTIGAHIKDVLNG